MYSVSFKFNGLQKTDEQLNVCVDDAENRLRERMLTKSGFDVVTKQIEHLNASFRDFDENGNGTVSLDEFIKAMFRHQFVGMDDVLTALFHRYDVNDSGSLDFREFSNGLYGVNPVPAASVECRSLCQTISRRLTQGRGNRALVLALRQLDKNGDGTMEPEELDHGLREFGVDLTPGELKVLCKYFDRNSDGRISVEEFNHTVRGDINQWRTRMVHLAFDHIDADNSGAICFKELKEAYRADLHPDVQHGIHDEATILSEFIGSWMKDEADTISRTEFLDYYKDASLAVASDDDFTQLLKQTWRSRTALPRQGHVHVMITQHDGAQVHAAIDPVHLPQRQPLDKTTIELALRRQGAHDILKFKVLDGAPQECVESG
eukprot:TRINITY_DN11275_c0_g1_i1.p1 TRINITY_DN11275_c0_g1~~TRINITY_DN11275_c0_g1_i1.p1  ORF type:complete len:376 (+),score=151.95 TRINITY_DN11275_c0_g1_i1:108-1235(+)